MRNTKEKHKRLQRWSKGKKHKHKHKNRQSCDNRRGRSSHVDRYASKEKRMRFN